MDLQIIMFNILAYRPSKTFQLNGKYSLFFCPCYYIILTSDIVGGGAFSSDSVDESDDDLAHNSDSN